MIVLAVLYRQIAKIIVLHFKQIFLCCETHNILKVKTFLSRRQCGHFLDVAYISQSVRAYNHSHIVPLLIDKFCSLGPNRKLEEGVYSCAPEDSMTWAVPAGSAKGSTTHCLFSVPEVHTKESDELRQMSQVLWSYWSQHILAPVVLDQIPSSLSVEIWNWIV